LEQQYCQWVACFKLVHPELTYIQDDKNHGVLQALPAFPDHIGQSMFALGEIFYPFL
jgi:hypothetical protein